MTASALFDPELIGRYDLAGPRYTSYPTAMQFHDGFGANDYVAASREAVRDGRPISLYVHVPFCATLCFYCACNKVITKRRERATAYLDYLGRELAMRAAAVRRGATVEQLHFGGGTPTFLDAEQMAGLMATIGEHFSLRDDEHADYSIEIDPRSIDRAGIGRLRAIGFNRISVGVQDFEPRVQKAVNRIQSEAQTLAVVEGAREHGFRSVNFDLIYGLPHQTVASFTRTLDKVIAAGPDRISVFNYAHLPHRFKPRARLRAENLPAPHEKLAILQGTIERLGGAGYVYIGMDHFARADDPLTRAQDSGALQRNFQGYSTHGGCELIAVGPSAISEVAGTYSQNHRDLDGYYAAIDAGRLPVWRGLRLTRDDRIRRAAIMGVICDFRLDLAAFGARWEIDFAEYFAPEMPALEALAADGLLRLEDGVLSVEPRGRLLVRNVCMVFDRYLGGAGDRPAYSRVI